MTFEQNGLDWQIRMLSNGAVVLGDSVTCDGYLPKIDVRVQTHIHVDHMTKFESSMHGEIYMLEPTRDLLIAATSEWQYRRNIKSLEPGERKELKKGGFVELYDASHMLGSAQAVYEGPDGFRMGYSGDFGWPTDSIKVDQIVLDGTSGPNTIRNYSQEEAEAAFLELARSEIRKNRVVVIADVESAFRVMELLPALDNPAAILHPTFSQYVSVYEKYGVLPPTSLATPVSSEEAEEELKKYERDVIYFLPKGKRLPRDEKQSTIRLMPFYTRPDQLVFAISEKSFDVGISNHADFNQTMKYVEESKDLSHVLVDNYRGKKAVELALEINNQFPHLKISYEVEDPGVLLERL